MVLNKGQLKRVEGLDILRALAIIMVMLLHARQICHGLPSWISLFFSTGWIGVDIFFVLSGFLIGKQVFDEPDIPRISSLKTFWIKRWLRTVPLYLSILAVYVFIKPLMGFQFKGGNISYLFFLQNYIRMEDFTHSWSLCIEEQFYIGFPILAFIFALRYKKPVVWLIPVLTSMLFRYLKYRSGVLTSASPVVIDYNIRFITHMHLDGISMGVFLAATFDHWIKYSIKFRTLLGILGAVMSFTLPFLSGYHLPGPFYTTFGLTLISLGFAFMLMWFYTLSFPKLALVPLTKIAIWSYGIYLWNPLVYRSFEKLDLNLYWPVLFTIFMICSGLIAFATYHIVELPFLKIRNMVLKRLANRETKC